eukprot:1903143-Pyramimonas_sp.AAC.1
MNTPRRRSLRSKSVRARLRPREAPAGSLMAMNMVAAGDAEKSTNSSSISESVPRGNQAAKYF